MIKVKWSVVLFEDSDQKLTTMSVLCYPYGSGISCMCDNRGRIYRCVAQVDTIHNVGQDPDPVLDQTLVHDSPSDPSQTLDERTEVILAATFLVLVVLTFVAWVISSLYGPKAVGREKSALRVTKQPSLRETSWANGWSQQLALLDSWESLSRPYAQEISPSWDHF